VISEILTVLAYNKTEYTAEDKSVQNKDQMLFVTAHGNLKFLGAVID
jgi:hypothetical protein